MTVAVAVAVAAALVATAVGVAVLIRYRALVRRGREVAARLDVGGEIVGDARPGDICSQLERAADRLLDRQGRVEVEAGHLRRALTTIPQGVVLVDTQGRPVFRNAVAEAYDGARHGDALVEAAVAEVLGETLRGDASTRPLELFGPPRRSLVITALPLVDGGGGSGAIAVIEDVTERHRLDAVRRDFVANISHELRTPVGALGLLAETMLEEESPEVRARLANRMLAETDRVAHTIDDLLTLSRIESEERPEREPVPAGLVIAEAVERIRPAAEQRDIEVVAADPPVRLAAFGDRRQLVSALYNLLDNAVKYSDGGSEVEVSATTDGVMVDFVVSDRGVGIPASDRTRIFERFYRVDQARSRQTGGTGLGLSIVRHVATNHGGRVVVESSVGEGSTFVLRIPTASGPVAVASSEAS